MKKTFWFLALVATALVIFSVQNAGEVTVKLFFKEVSISLAILLISVFVFGAIVGAAYFAFFKKQHKKPADQAIDKPTSQSTTAASSDDYDEELK